MACIDVKNVVNEYGTVEDLVKEICSDRACTWDAIQKNLKAKNIEITEPALIAVIAQIEEMIVFSKAYKYDVAGAVTYKCKWFGLIDIGEKIGNTIVRIEYKNFYLYNVKMCTNDAFREHIFSKLEFEELRRVPVATYDGLRKALEELNIEKDKWVNYVFVDDERFVHCKKWHKRGGFSTTECLGKLVRLDKA